MRVGHLEINYGDAHFRRSDNGNAMYNPFVGNYILDAFTTEIGGEVVPQDRAASIAMGADHRRRDPRHRADARTSAARRFIGKLGFDRQVQQGPARPPDRLDVHDRQGDEQHALRRRPRRLALLLRAGEHRGDRERRRHLGPDQPGLQEQGHGVAGEPVREVPRPRGVRRDRARRGQGVDGDDRAHVEPVRGRRGLPLPAEREAVRRRAATTRRTGELAGITGDVGRRAVAGRRRLVHHAEPADEGRVRQAEVLRLPGDATSATAASSRA